MRERLGELTAGSVAIVRALPGLGDMLCVVPGMRALRAALPTAHITLVGLPWTRAWRQRYPHYVDEFIEFPGFPGLLGREPLIHRLPSFFQDMQERSFDLALQLQGSSAVSNAFAMLLGARRTAGYYIPGQYCPDPDRFLPYVEHEPEPLRSLRLLDHLGVPPRGAALEFPVREADRRQLAGVLSQHGDLQPPYACLHPGGISVRWRWPATQFAALGRALAQRGLSIVLTGSQAERQLTDSVSMELGEPHVNLAGETTRGALAALLEGASVLICNDTGVSHLAAALAVPSVVIFAGSDMQRWGPIDHQLHRRLVNPPSNEGSALAVSAVLAEVDAVRRESSVHA